MSFEPEAIVETLNRHGVRYVVIGALALLAQGAPIEPTADIDISPERSKANLGRLADALLELRAHLRGHNVPDDLPFLPNASSLARHQDFVNLTCSHGDFDLCFQPAGFPNGYTDLSPGAIEATFGQLVVMVASVDDVLASKAAAGREKDLRVLPGLHRWREERG